MRTLEEIAVDLLYTTKPGELYEWCFVNHNYEDVDIQYMLDNNPKCYAYMPKDMRVKYLDYLVSVKNHIPADTLIALLRRDDFDGKELAKMMDCFGNLNVMATVQFVVMSGKSVPYFLEKRWINECQEVFAPRPISSSCFGIVNVDEVKSIEQYYETMHGVPLSPKALRYAQMISIVEK